MAHDGTTADGRVAEAYAIPPASPSWRERFGRTTAAVLVADGAAGRIVYATEACARLHGVAPDALVGAPLADLATSRAAAALADALQRVAVERVLMLESEHRRADGSSFPARVDLRAEGDGAALHHVLMVEDLSTRRTPHGRGAVVGSFEDATEQRAAQAAAEQLQRLTAALAGADDEREIATIVLGESVRAFDACGGSAVRLVEGEDVVEIIAHTGYADSVASRYRRHRLDLASPTTDAIRANGVVIAHDAREIEARYPELVDIFRGMGARGIVGLPLRVAERTVGGLALYLAAPERFGVEQRRMLDAFAGQCAQAMERVRHLEAERAARASEAYLAAAGAALAESLDHEVTLQRVADLVVPGLADWCVVYLAEASGAIRRVALGASDEMRAALSAMERTHPMTRERGGALARVVVEGAEIVVPDVTDEMLRAWAMDDAHYESLRAVQYHSVLALPLRARGAIIGALLLGTRLADPPRRLGVRDVDVARRLADRAALAIDNARLYADATAARRRVAFLAEASRMLVDSLEFKQTLPRVARSFVPDMADWCAVDLLNDAGGVDLVAVAHKNPERERWGRALRDQHPVDLSEANGLSRVLREGVSEFYPMIDDAMLAAAARTREELALLREIGYRSFICAPMKIRDTVIGAVTLVYTAESSRHYDAEDLQLAEELARRAATAIGHARAYRAAHIANQVKSEFLAVMSHELRTPLNAIGGYVELIELGLRGPLTDAQRRDLARIRASQQHLLGLISAVLDLSRIESGRVTYALEPVPVDAFLQTLDALIAPQVAAKSLVLAYEPCAPSLGVAADREKLRQILLNLLSNAVRYTPAGGRVTLRAETSDASSVAIDVEDTGVGIPAPQLARIFEPFVQLDRTLSQPRDGVGLGLAISRDLARGMGGDLTVESSVGAGSRFTLTLPRAVIADPDAWARTAEMRAMPPA